MELVVEIPCLPPSVNKAYPSTRSGRRFKSSEYKKFCDLVDSLMEDAHTPVGRLSVEIELISDDWYTKSGDARRRDCGNYSKTCLDAVFANLEVDDKWIWSEKISKVDGDVKRTIVRIYEIDLQ